jgi:hypothetical protein
MVSSPYSYGLQGKQNDYRQIHHTSSIDCKR